MCMLLCVSGGTGTILQSIISFYLYVCWGLNADPEQRSKHSLTIELSQHPLLFIFLAFLCLICFDAVAMVAYFLSLSSTEN